MTSAAKMAHRQRFGSPAPVAEGAGALAPLLDRRACRRFRDAPVDEGLVRLVLAAGLSAPSKSDLQQADIVWLRDPAVRAEVTRGAGEWIPGAAEFLVICANGKRFADLFAGGENPNDHFDALFNATVDAGVVLSALVSAAALVGLGACPVSVIRNRVAEVSAAMDLPERVFPVAGLALGWPEEPQAPISPRLGLDATVHIDRYDTAGQAEAIAAYDRRRAAEAPYRYQRDPERFGVAELYGWSEDKRRQYSTAQRAGFGAFLRAKGFSFE